MKILFYVNPLTANGDPLFFLGAIRHKLIPLARACLALRHDVTMVVPDHLVSLIESPDIPITVIDTEALSQGIGLRGELDYHIYRAPDVDNPTVKIAGKFYQSNVKFDPDLIVVWENTSVHLQQAFPDAKILHLMPGFLSRLPYPELVYFDTQGLFKQSRLYTESESILAAAPTSYSRGLAGEIRQRCEPFFAGMDLISAEVDELASQGSFRGIALLPMQYSRHYNFRVDTPYQSQAEYLLDVVAKVSSEQGLLITQYVSGGISDASLSPEFLAGLHRKHPNVLFNPKFDELDNISQFLLPFADSVITCSSSLGLQGILYGKPINVVQDTFLARIASGAQESETQRSNLLAHLLGRASVHWKRLLEPQFLSRFLEAIVDPHRQYADFDLHSIDSDYGSRLIEDLRFTRTMQKSGEFLRSNKKSAQYISPSVTAAIEGASLISFDIFDTLVERPLAQPSDVFLALERRWKQRNPGRYLELSRARIEAEALAKAGLQEGVEEVTLSQIYDELGLLLGLTALELESLMDMELQLEEALLTVRPIGRELYEAATRLNKKIIYASDMYLPAEFIKKVLGKNGFNASNTLYLSCELGLKKKSGTMFAHILDAEGLAASDVVHFGDNPQGDDAVPKSLGINSYRLPRAVDRMRGHARYKSRFKLGGRGERSLHESAMAYLVARRLFDNPFAPPTPDAYFNKSEVELGYCGFGPCVTDFALWLGQRVQANQNDGLFFVARDGRVVMEAYQALFPNAEHQTGYIFGSRRLLRTSFAPSLAELYASLGDLQSKRPSDLLLKWYGWETSDETLYQVVDGPDALKVARQALADELPKIQASHTRNSALLFDHAKALGALDVKAPALVEIGYAGTIQEGYERAIGLATRGYYFTLFDTAHARISDTLPMEGYVGHLVDRHYNWHGISRNGFLYETLFCSDEATILGIRRHGDLVEAVRENSAYDTARRSFIRKVHRGARCYAEDFAGLIGPIFDLLSSDPALGARILDDFVQNPAGSDAALLEGVVFSNNFDDGQFRYVVPPRALATKLKTVWPKGTAAFLETPFASKTPSVSTRKATPDKTRAAVSTKATLEALSPAEKLELQFRNGGHPNLLRRAAEQYAQLGETKKAIELLEEARTKLPKNRKLKLRLLVLRYPMLKIVIGDNKFDPGKK